MNAENRDELRPHRRASWRSTREATPHHPVASDAQRLERAITNLLGNALKFTPPGGGVVLEARAPRDASSVHIEVRDTGEGIAEDELPRIFDFYQQAESGHRLAGVGLGLAIVKRIIDAHYGKVSVRSQRGFGTVFSIDLPLAGQAP